MVDRISFLCMESSCKYCLISDNSICIECEDGY